MKYLKVFILAAVAAAAVTAVAGAGTASADFLCTTTPTPCTNSIGMIEASIKANAKFSETGGMMAVVDECKGSKLTWKIENQPEKGAVSGSILGLTWAGCEGGGLAVPTETVSAGKLLVTNIGGTMNGSVEATGTAVTLKLPFIGSCIYGFSTLGTLTSGAGATIDVIALGSKAAGSAAACQMNIKLTAEYVISNHTAVFVHHS